MNKWNMIIDVAECTNCNLCTLAAMDEYVGNDFPGYSAPMPRHGHKWIDILQKTWKKMSPQGRAFALSKISLPEPLTPLIHKALGE